MIFERTLREEAVLLLFRALLRVEPSANPYEVKERAESFAALADEYQIPLLEVVDNWILFERTGHERTRPAFVRWCEGVVRLRSLARQPLELCPRCAGCLIQRCQGRALCSACGEV